MKIQLIRNATMKLTYAGRTLLTDPMLSPKGAIRSFAGIAENPTVELPMETGEIVKGIDAVVVTHVHPDHYDEAAGELLPKTIPLFCRPGDEGRMAEDGFSAIVPVETSRTWEGITITRTGGEHGRGEILERMGTVSGFVFQAEGEPTVYWVGDSIWCDAVKSAIKTFKPDIIITHSGGATIPGFEPILMDAGETLAAALAAPESVVVAIHLEALDHCTVTREALRKKADRAAVPPERLMIPEDGEILAF